jgi:hypothetical protein
MKSENKIIAGKNTGKEGNQIYRDTDPFRIARESRSETS